MTYQELNLLVAGAFICAICLYGYVLHAAPVTWFMGG